MKSTTQPNAMSQNFNRVAYAAFAIVGVGFLLAKDLSQAAVFLPLALVFDPFNQEVPFGKRPFYQRAWLVIHLLASFTVFGFLIASN